MGYFAPWRKCCLKYRQKVHFQSLFFFFFFFFPSSISEPTIDNITFYRYILRRGVSGYYSYAVFERLEGWPEVEIDQIRIVYKLRSDK
jgi:hypothetical protein